MSHVTAVKFISFIVPGPTRPNPLHVKPQLNLHELDSNFQLNVEYVLVQEIEEVYTDLPSRPF